MNTVEDIIKRIELLKEYYIAESKKLLDSNLVMLSYDFNSRYIALKHLLEDIEGVDSNDDDTPKVKK